MFFFFCIRRFVYSADGTIVLAIGVLFKDTHADGWAKYLCVCVKWRRGCLLDYFICDVTATSTVCNVGRLNQLHFTLACVCVCVVRFLASRSSSSSSDRNFQQTLNTRAREFAHKNTHAHTTISPYICISIQNRILCEISVHPERT